MTSHSLPRRRGGALRRLGWLSAIAMLAVSAFAPTAFAGAADPIQPIVYTSEDYESLDGNPTCVQLDAEFGGGQTWTDAKLDKAPVKDDSVTVAGVGTITITAADGDTFSWSSTFGIDAVFVKTGEGNDKGINVLYVYAPTAASPEATVGTGLTDQGGQTGISHVSFCWDTGTPPTPTPVVTPTPAPVGAIEIFKVDNKGTAPFEDDEFLDGATFAIYLDDGDSTFEPAEDTLAGGPAKAVDGILTIADLAGGSYWIVETVVPTGFVGSDPILIDLNLDASLICFWDSTGSLGCEDGEGPSDTVFVDNTPEGAPTPTGSELPVESDRPTPSGQVGGVIGTPNVTPPTTDALSDATSAASGGWRIVLAGLAGLIVLALVFTQPARARRER